MISQVNLLLLLLVLVGDVGEEERTRLLLRMPVLLLLLFLPFGEVLLLLLLVPRSVGLLSTERGSGRVEGSSVPAGRGLGEWRGVLVVVQEGRTIESDVAEAVFGSEVVVHRYILLLLHFLEVLLLRRLAEGRIFVESGGKVKSTRRRFSLEVVTCRTKDVCFLSKIREPSAVLLMLMLILLIVRRPVDVSRSVVERRRVDVLLVPALSTSPLLSFWIPTSVESVSIDFDLDEDIVVADGTRPAVDELPLLRTLASGRWEFSRLAGS